MKLPKCMYCIPHELSGAGCVCILFKDYCNRYDEDCIAFRRSTKASREELIKAIEEMTAERKEESDEQDASGD